MILGYGLVWFSLITTLAGMVLYFPGLRAQGPTRTTPAARWMVYLSSAGLIATIAYLWQLILTHQFQVTYVFRYSSLDMPLKYVISSMWGGQEGTFLLWAVYGGLLAVFLRFKARQYEAPANFFYMGITLFLLMMLVRRSPFGVFETAPLDGNGLNPLLQDPWMTIHPPIMFLGFASLGIPAAFAMAALVREDWDQWVPRALPWTLLGVLTLGTGLTLGGYWSYSILGWGGYWGWDPVENSSLVPWLLSITLLHTQIIQLRRGLFRRANLLLSMLPFILLTYSTFLTRSGVLADFSVHSFTDLGINQFLVAFMAVFLGGGFLIWLWKVRRIPTETTVAPFSSREYFLFLGALSFGLFGAFVCLGTSAPLISKIWGAPGNVQPEFYNRIGLPFSVLITILVGTAPHLLWQRGVPGSTLWNRLRGPFLFSLALIPSFLLLGVTYWPHVIMMWGGAYALVSNAKIVFSIGRKKPTAIGGYLAHVGLGFMILGIITSTTLDSTELVQLPKGQEVHALGYHFRYLGKRPVEEGRKDAFDVVVTKGDKTWMMSPTMYFSEFTGGMMKKPAIQSLWDRDIYVAPGGEISEPVSDRLMTYVTLAKKQTQALGDLVFTFDSFETSSMDPGETAGMTVAALVDVTVDGVTHRIQPKLVGAASGGMESVPAAIPGTHREASLEGVDASNGMIQLGVAEPPLRLAVGETGGVQGFQVTFNDFGVDMGTGRGTKIAVHADCTVTYGDDVWQLKPGVIHKAGMEPQYDEAVLGDTGLNLVLASVSATERTAQFYVAREPQEALWVEASLKPFIVLLWIGTGLVISGVLLAAVFRGRLAGAMAARLGEGMGVLSGKREAA